MVERVKLIPRKRPPPQEKAPGAPAKSAGGQERKSSDPPSIPIERTAKPRRVALKYPTSIDFFRHLRWIDGRPLLDTVEPYRRAIFTRALDTYRPDGVPAINFVLAGRGKKNWKTADLVLAGLYVLMIRNSVHGCDGFILANDEQQANDDLTLAKKLIAINPDLAAELQPLQKEIRRRDGRGSLMILPAHDIAGSHGKTYGFIGFDEIHSYKTYDLFEALAPDPTRADALTWVTSYDTIFNTPGIPLHDFKETGRAGTDPRMLFSWYSGDLVTDPAFAELEPELRANPSIASWPEGRAYLDQQRRRLPTHKFRRLHLNLPGSPNGAFFDQGSVLAAIATGRTSAVRDLTPRRRFAGVDMSGGSIDDACLSVAFEHEGKIIVDLVVSQAGRPVFNPRDAVRKFAGICKGFDPPITRILGDAFAGTTFRHDFAAEGIRYDVAKITTSEAYEALEPKLNAGEVELPDVPKLTEQLLTLVLKGSKVTHSAGEHDDFAAACALAVYAASGSGREKLMSFAGVVAAFENGRASRLGRRGSPSNPHTIGGVRG